MDKEAWKEHLEIGEQAAAELIREREQRAWNEFMSDTWNSALQEAGLTQEEYANLAAGDQEHVKGVVKKGMKALTQSIRVRAEDKRRGRRPRVSVSEDKPKSRLSRELIEEDLKADHPKGDFTSDDFMKAALDRLLPEDDSSFWPQLYGKK